MKRALATIEVPSVLEPVGLCRSDGKRPDGMSIIPWKRGRALVWDVTVWDIFAPSYSGHAAGEFKLVLWLTWLKLLKDICILSWQSPIILSPLGLIHLVSFGDSARSFFKGLGCRTRTLTGDPQSYHKLCQQISVTIQRFNCLSIICSSRHAMDSLLD